MSQSETANPAPATDTRASGKVRQAITTLLPGVALSAGLAWLSIALADFTGTKLLGFDKSPISAVMVAMLLGLMTANVLPLATPLRPGIRFSAKYFLRAGIILLGIRLSVFDVFELGVVGIPIVLLCVSSALLFMAYATRLLKLPPKLGALIAVGTSICGVSAILATGPAIDAEDEDVAYAVAVITLFGLIATLLYPFAADAIFSSDATKAGLFLGTAIHDTSQVTGAGLIFAEVFDSPRGLDVAAVTKMVRNVLMVVIVPLMAWRAHRNVTNGTHGRISLLRLAPLFVLGFIGMAIVRSAGDMAIETDHRAFGLWDMEQWTSLYSVVQNWAVIFLVVALAGVGLSIRLSIFRELSLKPFLAGLIAALVVGVVSIITISLLGSFVTL